MKCPKCNSADLFVRNTQKLDSERAIRRYRHCKSCGHGFVTLERVEAFDRESKAYQWGRP